MPAPWDALVLTGGRARRLGGADKATVVVGDRTLAARVAAAVEGAAQVVVVGPVPAGFPPGTIGTVEDPAGGGPVAAVAAGLGHVAADEVAVLAVDLPFVTAGTLTALRVARVAAQATAAMPVDGDGRDQPLCSVWSTAALRSALAALGDPAGAPMHRLVARAEPIRRVPGLAPAWFDCDTPADVAAATELAR